MIVVKTSLSHHHKRQRKLVISRDRTGLDCLGLAAWSRGFGSDRLLSRPSLTLDVIRCPGLGSLCILSGGDG